MRKKLILYTGIFILAIRLASIYIFQIAATTYMTQSIWNNNFHHYHVGMGLLMVIVIMVLYNTNNNKSINNTHTRQILSTNPALLLCSAGMALIIEEYRVILFDLNVALPYFYLDPIDNVIVTFVGILFVIIGQTTQPA